jgi:hypothetical protein
VNAGDGVKLFATTCGTCKLPEKPGGRHLHVTHCLSAFKALNQSLGQALEAATAAAKRNQRLVQVLWLLVGKAGQVEVDVAELGAVPKGAGIGIAHVDGEGDGKLVLTAVKPEAPTTAEPAKILGSDPT